MKLEFILASSSPRRKELLKLIGIQPRIISPHVDESRLPGEKVDDFLRRVTIAKGREVYGEEFYNIPVISADTIVLCDDHLIGKPVDRDEAFGFLKLLSGNKHEVWTGLSILYRGEVYYEVARTGVLFSELSEEEINHYLEIEHYMDKAGAYAIQGRASVFVRRIEGCYFNVMGFPLNLFYTMLKTMGIPLI
ncbi:MAG: septum formation protein Maf [bacterium]|nr:septum formation protein Maf [bacterium]